MAEETQVQRVTTKDPQQVTMKEPQQVTAKNPKKLKAGKRLAEWNCKNREELKVQKSEVLTLSQYGIGAVLAVGMIGGLGYYLYQAKKGEVNAAPPPQ